MDIVPHISIYPHKLVMWNSFEAGHDAYVEKKEVEQMDFDLFPCKFSEANPNFKPLEHFTPTPPMSKVSCSNLSLQNLLVHNPDGSISNKANKRIGTAVAWLCHLAKEQSVSDSRLKKEFKFKINFITLSLPSSQIKSYTFPNGNVVYGPDFRPFFILANRGIGKLRYYYSDKWIKSNLLNQFLVELRNKFQALNYVWRAETQENGNIHFHITLNQFIYLGDLRDMWNRILSKTNFISRYQSKFKVMSFQQYYEYRNQLQSVSEKKCLKAFERGVSTNWLSPNSTDVHSVKNVRDIINYLSKYFGKNADYLKNKKDKFCYERRLIEGNLWRLSEMISKFKCFSTTVGSSVDAEWNYLKSIFKTKCKSYDYSEILYIKISDVFMQLKNSLIVQYFSSYVDKLINRIPIPIADVPPDIPIGRKNFLNINWDDPVFNNPLI